MTRIILLTIAALMAAPAAAQTYESGEGVAYELACNASGYVLTPDDRSLAVLYLGKSCDAAEGEYSGTWCSANGGFAAEMGDRSVGFPRQELSCDLVPDLAEDCRC